MFISLQYKISFIVFCSCLFVLLSVTILTPIFISNQIEKDIKTHLNAEIGAILLAFIQEQEDTTWGTIQSAQAFAVQFSIQDLTLIEGLEHIPFPRNNPGEPPSPGDRLFFRLADMNGFALLGFDEYPAGSQIPAGELNRFSPLYVKDKPAAYIYYLSPPPMTRKNEALVESMKNTMKIGFYIALIVALLVGIVSGSGITKSLRHLTEMAASLKEGLRGQQIREINSRDEIGRLAKVLNEMSIELEKSHRTIKELALTDELTGLYNRRFFNEQIKILASNAHRYDHNLTVVLGDVDHFKKVNDNFSHTVGDKVLTRISAIIQEGVREGDLTTRYGGEEIVIVLSESDREESVRIIERIRQSIESWRWEEIAPGLKVTMSFGVCTLKAPESYREMVEEADRRLYIAKDSGRNRVVAEGI